MSTLIEGIAAYKVTDKNKILDKGYFQMEYDGNEFNMAGVQNDQIMIMSMTNDDIMELLSRRSDPRPIEERLELDFGKPIIVKSPSKKSHRRKPKSTSSKRKTKTKTKTKTKKPSKITSMPTITKTPAYYKD